MEMTIEMVIQRFKEECVKLRRQLAPLQDGTLRTGEKTLDRPEWTDTTDESIKDCQRKISELEEIIAKYPQFR